MHFAAAPRRRGREPARLQCVYGGLVSYSRPGVDCCVFAWFGECQLESPSGRTLVACGANVIGSKVAIRHVHGAWHC
jgi:hypothetical protein